MQKNYLTVSSGVSYQCKFNPEILSNSLLLLVYTLLFCGSWVENHFHDIDCLQFTLLYLVSWCCFPSLQTHFQHVTWSSYRPASRDSFWHALLINIHDKSMRWALLLRFLVMCTNSETKKNKKQKNYEPEFPTISLVLFNFIPNGGDLILLA